MKTKVSGQMSLRLCHMLQFFFFFPSVKLHFFLIISYILKYGKDSVLHAMLFSCLLCKRKHNLRES